MILRIRVNTFLSSVKKQAGWSNFKFPTLITGILGFLADFFNPIFDILSWSVVIVLPLAVFAYVLCKRDPLSKIRAQVLLISLIASLVFSTVFAANIVTQTFSNEKEEDKRSFVGSFITPVGNLQEKLFFNVQKIQQDVEQIRASNERQEEAIDQVMGHAKENVKTMHNVDNNMELAVALSLLDRALQTRDGSIQGQKEALQSLVNRGYEYANANLSGVNFKDAQIAGINLKGAKLHWSDFRGANLSGANLENAGMRFAQIQNIDLSNAVLSASYSPFINAQGANFYGSNLSHSLFVGGDFRNANFTNANLDGAVFAFADLRGAIFLNARLKNTFFIGAILDDANFDGAIFNDTDMRAANTKRFNLTDAQKLGICQHYGPKMGRNILGWRIKLQERYDSNRFSSGYEYSDLPTRNDGFSADSFSLPLCNTSPDSTENFDATEPGSDSMNLDREYLSNAGRRKATIQRLNSHLDLLKEHIVPERFLKLEKEKLKEWADYIYKAMDRTLPIGAPVLEDDMGFLYALNKKIINENDVDWITAFRMRHGYEEQFITYSDEEKKRYSYWQHFFPVGAPLEDLPKDALDIFKRWTLRRAEQLPESFFMFGSIHPHELRNNDGKTSILPLEKMALISPGGGGYYNFPWPQKRDFHNRTEVTSDRALVIPGGGIYTNRAEFGFLIMQQPTSMYNVVIPNELVNSRRVFVLKIKVKLNNCELIEPEALFIHANLGDIELFPFEDLTTSIWQGSFSKDKLKPCNTQ